MFYKLAKLFGYHSYAKINSQLYLSDCSSPMNPTFIKNHHVNVIVNCSTNIKFHTEILNLPHIKTYRLSVKDDLSIISIMKMTKILQYISPILNKHLNLGHVILIHCRAGIQRSASVMAGLFMYRYNLTKWESIKIIRSKRLLVFLPMVNFSLSLDMYQKYLETLKKIT